MKSIAIGAETVVTPGDELSGYADTFVVQQRDRTTGKENKKHAEYFRAEDSSM
jgi:hypothetical protein